MTDGGTNATLTGLISLLGEYYADRMPLQELDVGNSLERTGVHNFETMDSWALLPQSSVELLTVE